MDESERKVVTIGAIALIGLLVLSSFSFLGKHDATLTGAVAGESYRFEQCLKKYGRDLYGKWMWDEIQKCREEVDGMSKGKDKAIPRLYLSDDRSEFQNE